MRLSGWVTLGLGCLVIFGASILALDLSKKLSFPYADTIATAPPAFKCGKISLLPEKRVPPREVAPGTWEFRRTSGVILRPCASGTLEFRAWSADARAPSPPILEVQQGDQQKSLTLTNSPKDYRIQVRAGQEVAFIAVNASAFQRLSHRIVRLDHVRSP